MSQGYVHNSTNNTRAANSLSARFHGRGTPGDRLVAAALPQPAKKRKVVAYEPDFGDDGDVWRRAESRSIKVTARPVVSQSRVATGEQMPEAPDATSSATRTNFAGILQNLDEDTMLNEHGFPLNEDDVARIRREENNERTSQGKVSLPEHPD
ncbi:unnamed protein product [Peniophora sp. CBMAI 1063]|nr:unnamed protein product [Peniophora sp. CBMAI 1063]